MTYTWRHKPTGLKIEVERKMEDYDIPPTIPELCKVGLHEEDFLDPNAWEKVVTGGSHSVGFGNKGNW